MQAVIMAGGRGTRLHPFTATFPKPLVPLGDMPVLELLLRRLKHAGVTEAILAVNHLSHLIRAFFGDGEQIGIKITYATEDKPLGTAGALGAIIDKLDENFILTNGDLLTTMNIAELIKTHRTKKAAATIGVHEREVKIDFGMIDIDSEMRLVGYHEKPTYKHFVSMGIYVLNRESVRAHVKPNEYLDMPTLLLKMKDAGKDVRCFNDACFWLDIGRPDDFAQAQEIFERDRSAFLPD